MSLFTKLAPLVQAGAVVHITLRQVGANMQLEILPEVDAGKTGISIPPRAFQATPEELDAKIPGFLDTYVGAAVNLSDQIAVTVAVMDKAQEDARETTKKAQVAKTTTPARATTAPTSGTKPAKTRNTNAGFLEEDDPGGDDEGVASESGGQPDSESQVGALAPAGTGSEESLF